MGEFRPVITEALFIEMESVEGRYEPLIGYIPLEQGQAVVDLAGHRLAKFGRVDLKAVGQLRVVEAAQCPPIPCQQARVVNERRYRITKRKERSFRQAIERFDAQGSGGQ